MSALQTRIEKLSRCVNAYYFREVWISLITQAHRLFEGSGRVLWHSLHINQLQLSEYLRSAKRASYHTRHEA